MIGEIIQKMQELAAMPGNFKYTVDLISEEEKGHEDTMAVYECNFDLAREVEGMLSADFGLEKGKEVYLIGIKRSSV